MAYMSLKRSSRRSSSSATAFDIISAVHGILAGQQQPLLPGLGVHNKIAMRNIGKLDYTRRVLSLDPLVEILG